MSSTSTKVTTTTEGSRTKIVTEIIKTYYDGRVEKEIRTNYEDKATHVPSVLKTKLREKDRNDVEGSQDFVTEALEAHNQFRSLHGVPPLKVSKHLSAFAQEWANKLGAEDAFYHRPNNEYGENLYVAWDSNPMAKVSGNTPVENWYNEIKEYDFSRKEPRSRGTGHFTQVIWKSSEEFGIATAKSFSGKMIVVANYYPAGNYIGNYSLNVLPLLKNHL